jgi:hypothetical protein
MTCADFIATHCPRIVDMTVTRARTPSLSGLPGRFPEEPEFKIARKPVGSGGPTPAPKPVSAEDMQRQQLNADQRMRRQVLQPMGIARENSPRDKNSGPPSAAPSSPAFSLQRGPGNHEPVRRKPLDEIIPEKNWAPEPEQYAALLNDPRVMFHMKFYGSGPQQIPASLQPQGHAPTRNPSAISAKTYPPRTAQAQPFLPNNGYPPLRNARSWQAPQPAVPYAHGPVESAPAQSSSEPPPRPSKEPLEHKVPPPLPPR